MKKNNLILIVLIFQSILFFFGEIINEYLIHYGIPPSILTVMKILVIILSYLSFLVLTFSKKNMIMVILFSILPLSSFLFTVSNEQSFYFSIIALSSISFYILILLYFEQSGSVNRFIKYIVIFSILFSILSFITDFYDVNRYIPNIYERSYHCGESYAFRWCGVTQNPNLIAIYSAFFVLTNMFFWPYLKTNKYKFLALFSIVLNMINLVMSMSRASLLFVMLFLLMYFICSRLGKKIKIFFSLLFFIINAFLLSNLLGLSIELDDFGLNALERINDTSNSVRLMLMNGGMSIFYDNPIFGIGYNLSPPLDKYVPGWNKPVDSYYINILYSVGSIISFFYFAMIFSILRCSFLRNKILFTMILSYLLLLVIEDHFYKTPVFWFFMALTHTYYYWNTRPLIVGSVHSDNKYNTHGA